MSTIASAPPTARPGRIGRRDFGCRGCGRDRWRYRNDPMLGPCRRLRAHHLLPDPAALVGEISVAEVVAAIDGDIGMTQCSVHVDDCERTTYCPTRPHWSAINRAVGAALSAVTPADMISPFSFLPAAKRVSAPETVRT